MAKDTTIVPTAFRRRTRVPAVAPVGGGAPAAAPRKRTGPIQFLREVRIEARKVTWTSWKETWITSIMVGIMVILTAIFFFGVDWILGVGARLVLKLANAE